MSKSDSRLLEGWKRDDGGSYYKRRRVLDLGKGESASAKDGVSKSTLAALKWSVSNARRSRTRRRSGKVEESRLDRGSSGSGL